MIDFLIRDFLEKQKAVHYFIESVSISQDTEIKENECILITGSKQTNYSFYSASEYYDDNQQGERITINKGFIKILSGTPILQGYKITITKVNQNPAETITIVKNKQNEIINLKIK